MLIRGTRIIKRVGGWTLGLSVAGLLLSCQNQDATNPETEAASSEAAPMSATAAGAAPVFEGQLKAPPSATVARTTHIVDGRSDDLLSAGLGYAGLVGAAPTLSQPPTTTELRRMAIYQAYRGLADLRPQAEMASGTRSDGKPMLAPIAGQEILALRHLHHLDQASAVLLQIPEQFDWQQPCLVAAATSGSRGIYGAIPVIAHWALPKGCAVIYTEKGTGNGVFLAASEQGYSMDGLLVSAAQSAFDPLAAEDLVETDWADYVEKHPHRLAFRHAHSGDNPEAEWGTFLIDATYFALDELNVRRPSDVGLLNRDNTRVILAGISNGGGAALAALEADDIGLFDGLAVAEPNVQVSDAPSLYASSTTANLYAACAVQAVDPASHPLAPVLAFQAALFNQRCEHLAEAGLLDKKGSLSLAEQALEKMHQAGYPASADPLMAFAVAYDLYPAIAATYASSYGRFSFYEPPCEVGFAYADAAGLAQEMPADQAEALFAMSSGIAPTANIQLVKADAEGQDRRAALVPGFAAMADGDLAGALCHDELNRSHNALAKRVQEGIRAVQRNANLRGRPAYIVHGAADNVVPVAHSSRAYVALNRSVEGEHSQLHYQEVEKAQHFDALLALPGYQQQYEALHPHYLQALDQLWQQLDQATVSAAEAG